MTSRALRGVALNVHGPSLLPLPLPVPILPGVLR